MRDRLASVRDRQVSVGIIPADSKPTEEHVILLLAVMHTHRRRSWQPSCKEAASNADGIVSSHSCCHIRVKRIFLFLAINWQEYLREGSRSLLWRRNVQMEHV